MTNTQEPNAHTTAIVLLNYNGRALLEQFLPQIVATPHAEVYVADNNSSDDSLAFLQQHYADTVHIIALERNYGFAEGYNIALRQICATYYVLLNTDVAVTAGWLQPLIATLEADATLAAVQPKIRAYSSPTLFEYAGGAGGYLDVLGYPLCRGRIFDTLEADTGQYDAAVACAWASGACMAVRARTFHAFGGFDGSFFAHMEEIDWCWRVRRAGFGIMAQPARLGGAGS